MNLNHGILHVPHLVFICMFKNKPQIPPESFKWPAARNFVLCPGDVGSDEHSDEHIESESPVC